MPSSEMTLIIAILKTCFHPPSGDELSRLEEGVDWESFIECARREGVAGLIYNRLKAAALLEAFPQNVCKQLEQRYYENVARNMCLLQGLKEIIREFERRGLSLLIMQGMALLEETYPALGARPLQDIDLMVRQEEAAAVRHTLKDLGYRPVKNYPWLYANDRLVLDVHTDAANISRIRARRHALTIPTDELWRDSVPLPQGGGKRSFCTEDLLLTLCAHLQKHSFNRLIWFVDVGLIIKGHRSEIDWARLLEKAERYNLSKPLLMVSSQLKSVFHVETPADVRLGLSRIKLNPLEKAVLGRLKAGRQVGRVGELLFALSLKGTRQRAAYLFETAFPRSEVMAQIHGLSSPPLIWFAYPLRFWQLLHTGIREAARLLKP